MFLMQLTTGDLIRVDEVDELFDPSCARVLGRDQAGEEEQEAQWFDKKDLLFPSGESLPRCWTDAHYRSGISMTSC